MSDVSELKLARHIDEWQKTTVPVVRLNHPLAHPTTINPSNTIIKLWLAVDS